MCRKRRKFILEISLLSFVCRYIWCEFIYCSHRSHCVHAGQHSDQTLFPITRSHCAFIKSNLAKSWCSLNLKYKQRHNLCLLIYIEYKAIIKHCKFVVHHNSLKKASRCEKLTKYLAHYYSLKGKTLYLKYNWRLISFKNGSNNRAIPCPNWCLS